jgi:hypothetical protein
MAPASPHLALFIHCYGGQLHVGCARSLLALRRACDARGVALTVELGGGEALIGRARAGMMAAFLSGPATHLLMVDADVGFPPEAVFRLLDAGKPVIGGAYPSKRQPPDGAPAWELDRLEGDPAPAEGLQRVAAVGAGFLLIAREAAQRITDAHPELRAGLRDVAGAAVLEAGMVFDSMIEPGTGRYLSDYQSLCRRWRDLGGEVWAHFGLGLSHVGEIEHQG